MRRNVPVCLIVSVLITALVLTIMFSYHYWEELKGTDSASSSIRNIGLVAGGFAALVLGLWRSAIAQSQVEVAEHDSLDNQFQKSAAMLGHEDMFVRLARVHALFFLGSNHLARYGLPVHSVLLDFCQLKELQRADGADQRIEQTDHPVEGKYIGPPDGAAAFDHCWILDSEIGETRGKRKTRTQRLRHRLIWLRGPLKLFRRR